MGVVQDPPGGRCVCTAGSEVIKKVPLGEPFKVNADNSEAKLQLSKHLEKTHLKSAEPPIVALSSLKGSM